MHARLNVVKSLGTCAGESPVDHLTPCVRLFWRSGGPIFGANWSWAEGREGGCGSFVTSRACATLQSISPSFLHCCVQRARGWRMQSVVDGRVSWMRHDCMLQEGTRPGKFPCIEERRSSGVMAPETAIEIMELSQSARVCRLFLDGFVRSPCLLIITTILHAGQFRAAVIRLGDVCAW